MNPDEAWLPVNIPGHPEYGAYYCVSNLGRIRTHVRAERRKYGVLNGKTRRNGYRAIGLSYENKTQNYLIHRIVLWTFGPPTGNTESLQCNHKNLNPSDNRIENLEWVTPRENMMHYRKFKNRKTLPEETVREILINPFNIGCRRAAKKYGVSRSAIISIRNGSRWSHLFREIFPEKTPLKRTA